ncbi:MAG TPA: hypothetical protein VGE01_08845, partial [Fimbriimonas sp.]
LWVHMAADRMISGRDLKTSEQQSLLKVVRAAARSDPENGFWPQMEAVFLHRVEKPAPALAAWRRASRCSTLNDYQSELLAAARGRIMSLTGSRQAWQLAYVYHARSDSAGILVERYARQLLGKLDLEGSEALDLRYVTLKNGSLLRDLSRSMAVGVRGADIVELASYPRNLSSIRSPKKLLLAQISMYNSLVDQNRPIQAASALQSFQQNDAWWWMAQRQDYKRESVVYSLQSLLTSALPSSLLFCGIIGTAVWGLGAILKLYEGRPYPPFAVALAASLLGFLTYFLSRNVLASVAIGLCVAFIAFGFDKGRTHRTEYVGPLFTFITSLLGLFFIVTFVLYVAGFALPTLAIVPQLGISGEFFGNQSMFIGLSAIVFGLLLLVAPAWSLVQRRSTQAMLSLALRRFGAFVSIGSFLLATAAAPVCIYQDRALERIFEQLVGNEPVYHLLR